ncbi:MAG: CAP domain-containing protein [Candidatus Diapherotrites archaeon]|nr:CAP domain-containing protein [Candidatus Diapherotrites archaeon]
MVRKSVKKSVGSYVKRSVRKVGEEREEKKDLLESIPVDKIKNEWERQKRERAAAAKKQREARAAAARKMKRRREEAAKKARAMAAKIKKPKPLVELPKLPWVAIARVVIGLFVVAIVASMIVSLVFAVHLCEDGTPYGQCSDTHPYVCTDGRLVLAVSKCGCGEGEREYKGSCILSVQCFDGTLEPECSLTKPLQCVGGELVENAGMCGCPSDYEVVGDFCEKIEKCVDGTREGFCSKTKPYLCSGGELSPKASVCGCPLGEIGYGDLCVPQSEASVREAFDHINSLRAEYGRNEILWDSRASDLALDRSRDMFVRGYTDHVTPEGECAKTMKSDYGLSSKEIVAENILRIWYASGLPAPTLDPMFAVDEWMTSRAHRYNLLYEFHERGGLGCYKNYCVFLGVHTKKGGFGDGPCSAWNETYWETAPPLPGEA